LGGLVPGSQNLKFTQTSLQPTSNTTDVVGVIKAVIEAEEAAINQYKKIIRETEGDDYVTQDLAIQLLADEEAHVVLFRGFLKEYAQG
jgi:bacterioferritin